MHALPLLLLACATGVAPPKDTGDGVPSDSSPASDSSRPSDSDTATVVDSDSGVDTGGEHTGDDTDETADEVDADRDGYTASDGDCDDADATVHPGADEVCEDGTDQDCDGDPADCLSAGPLATAASAKLSGAQPNGYAGTALASGFDFDADGFDDLLVGAMYASPSGRPGPGGTESGAVYLVRGAATMTDRSVADADVFWEGEPLDNAGGNAVAGAGDVDGDGFDDVAYGTPGRGEFDGHSDGGAWLVFGGSTSEIPAVFFAGATNDVAGSAVDGVGDLDGDGFDELAVGAVGMSGVYLFRGAADLASRAELSADATWTGGDAAGADVSRAGDVDGDGLGDLIIGDPGNVDAGVMAGAAFLVLGDGALLGGSLSAADAELTGAPPEDAGSAVAGGGDLNADGYDDVAVGAPASPVGGEYSGAVYIVLGRATPASGTLASLGVVLGGTACGGVAGSAIDLGDDVDDDGFGDVVVGAYACSDASLYAGAVYLVRGAAVLAPMSLADADVELTGEAAYDYAGASVAMGSLDGDAYADLLIGAYWNDATGLGAGAVYVVEGSGP